MSTLQLIFVTYPFVKKGKWSEEIYNVCIYKKHAIYVCVYVCTCVCTHCAHISDTIMHFDILVAQENKKDNVYFWLWQYLFSYWMTYGDN